tara:strand:+ start:347 stop:490 length:144 start_codon:yes stop_codon:yes gene_type:complete
MDTNAMNKNRLTVFSIAQILNLPKETARRKLEKLVKKKYLNILLKQV